MGWFSKGRAWWPYAVVLLGFVVFTSYRFLNARHGISLSYSAVAKASAESKDEMIQDGVDASLQSLGALRPALEGVVLASSEPLWNRVGAVNEMTEVPDRFVELLLEKEESPTLMLVRKAELELEIEGYDIFNKGLLNRLDSSGGHISNATVYRGRDRFGSAIIDVRVPNGEFDTMLGWLQETAHVSRITVSAEEVGEKWTDHRARLLNAQRTEAELASLLTQRAELKDILALEAELGRVRETIEQAQGTLRYLSNRVSLSSITLRLTERVEYKPIVAEKTVRTPYFTALRQTIVSSLGGLVEAARVGSLVFTAIFPWMVIAFGSVAGSLRLWRWRRS